LSTARADQPSVAARKDRIDETPADVRRRSVRRSALLLAAVALALYLGFIILSVIRAG